MARYSYGQLEQLWISGGGSKALAPLMAAIALAESAGDPQATNPNDNGGTQTSWGLWQISDGTHNQPVQNILDPLTNAKAAVAKYKQQGLSAWGTYDSGVYKQYYQGDVPPSSLPQGGGTQSADLTGFNPNWLAGPQGIIDQVSQWVAGQVTGKNPVTSVAGAVTAIAADLSAVMKGIEWWFKPGNAVRVVCFIIGIALFIPGLANLAKAGRGDMSMALGIIEVTIASALLFIAFHNLPADVTSIDELMGWLSAEIRGQSTKTTGAVTT